MITSTIEINRLRLRALHGVLVQERIAGNIFEVTVHLNYPITPAIKSDDITSTLNYADVVDIIKRVMEQPSQLLEHVAGRLQSTLIEHYPKIQGGYIRIAKMKPPISEQLESVAVSIKW